jgi:hypothetical protein
MLEYLLANKEWIFSGVGVAILGSLGRLLKRSRSSSLSERSSNPSFVRVEVVQAQSLTEASISLDTEATDIAKRFNQILRLMNEKRTYNKFTIAGLAQLMELQTVGELESVFLGSREPSFKFIDIFCSTFGVNKDWLTEGKGNPFGGFEKTHYDPLDYLEDIKQIEPSGIYFVRSKSEVGEVFLVLKLADWKYKIINRVWHISDHVGAGGQSQIFGMYKLILTLQKSHFSNRCKGKILPENRFEDLLGGKIFPGSVIYLSIYDSLWWDDFIDVYHKYLISSDYELWYGKGFTAAQSIVRWKLKEQVGQHYD